MGGRGKNATAIAYFIFYRVRLDKAEALKYWNITSGNRDAACQTGGGKKRESRVFNAKHFALKHNACRGSNLYYCYASSIRGAVIKSLFAGSSPDGERRGSDDGEICRRSAGTSFEGKQRKFVFFEYQQRRRVIAAEERKLLHTRGRRRSSRYTNRALPVQLQQRLSQRRR